jgi:hypothetical protein
MTEDEMETDLELVIRCAPWRRTAVPRPGSRADSAEVHGCR